MNNAQTVAAAPQLFNLLDVFLMLALAARLHGTNKGVRNTAWNLFYKCDDEAKEALRTLAINTQSPLDMVNEALSNYDYKPGGALPLNG